MPGLRLGRVPPDQRNQNGSGKQEAVSPEWFSVDAFLNHCYNFLEPQLHMRGVLMSVFYLFVNIMGTCPLFSLSEAEPMPEQDAGAHNPYLAALMEGEGPARIDEKSDGFLQFVSSFAGLGNEDTNEPPEHLFRAETNFREVVQADRQPAIEQVLDLTGF